MVSDPLTSRLVASRLDQGLPDSPMLLVCPNCGTSYQVEPATLGESGRSVRCVRCQGTWFAANTDAMAAIARAHRIDVTALTGSTPAEESTGPSDPRPAAPAEAVPSSGPDLAEPSIAPDPPAPDALAADLPETQELQSDAAALAETDEQQMDAPAIDEPAHQDAEAIIDAPPLVPVNQDDGLVSVESAQAPEDIESIAARRTLRPIVRRRPAPSIFGLPTIILALIAINMGLIAWRNDVVRLLPQTASLYAAVGLPVNLRGLVFEDIATRKETKDGVEMLVVEGFIRNETRRVMPVPRLRFAVRNAKGQEIYAWTAMPARNAIPATAMLPFRSRLASPPPETHQVLVRFFNKRDLVTGLQ
jgi:predicted Zn finger-like uncharacterized protein